MRRLAFVLLGAAVCAVAAAACWDDSGTQFPIEPGATSGTGFPGQNPRADSSFPPVMDGPITDATASDAPKLFNDGPEL